MINFQEEWIKMVDSELLKLGYKNISPDPVLKTIQLFTIYERKIDGTKRKVFLSKELASKSDKRIASIVKKFADGIDVNPHLSKTISNIDFKDMLLNDWGIYHFHLGEKIDSSGFIERTADVLFGIITNTNAYLVDIMPHDNWSEINLLEIIDANWPQLLETREVKGFIPEWTIKKNDEVFEMRKARLNYMVELKNGKIFNPNNMGYASSGHTISSVLNAQRYYHRKLSNAQENYIAKKDTIIKKLKEQYKYEKKEPYEFIAVFKEDAVGVIEKDSDIFFSLV